MEFVSEGCRELLGVAPADLDSGRIVYGSLIGAIRVRASAA